PSMMRMIGRRKSCAISSAIRGFAEIEASAEPPRTVKSSPTTTTVRPSILARPNTQFAGVSSLSSPCPSYSPIPETAPISWKLLGSTSASMRSRTVSRPWSRCRLTFSTPPISRANASRRASSSSSAFQFIRLLRPYRLVYCLVGLDRIFYRTLGQTGELPPFHPVVEHVGFAGVEHAADGPREFDHRRRRLLVQPRLVEHRRQQS